MQRDSEYVKTVDHFVPLLAQTVEDTLRGHALPLDGASPQTSLASACLTALRQYISYRLAPARRPAFCGCDC